MGFEGEYRPSDKNAFKGPQIDLSKGQYREVVAAPEPQAPASTEAPFDPEREKEIFTECEKILRRTADESAGGPIQLQRAARLAARFQQLLVLPRTRNTSDELYDALLGMQAVRDSFLLQVELSLPVAMFKEIGVDHMRAFVDEFLARRGIPTEKGIQETLRQRS